MCSLILAFPSGHNNLNTRTTFPFSTNMAIALFLADLTLSLSFLIILTDVIHRMV